MSPLTTWTFDPLQLAGPVVAAALYGLRVRTLARRGRPIGGARVVSFAAGLGCVLVALVSPIDAVGETRLFSAHMLQHLLLGLVAPLLLLLGLTRSVVAPVIGLRGMWRLRWLAHPFVALPLWTVGFYVWHLPALFDGALADDTVHALEHVTFIAIGLLVWAPVVEPVPAPGWFGNVPKLGYLLAWRLIDMPLAIFFLFGPPIYPTYERAPRLFGLSAGADQSTGGALEFLFGLVCFFAVFGWLFYRAAADDERLAELVALGVPERRARHALRYGRGAALLARTQAAGSWPPVRAPIPSGEPSVATR